MDENKYDYDFFEGDYLYQAPNCNISLACEAAVPFYFRMAFGEKDEFYTNYSDSILVQNLEAYYVFEKNIIYPKTKFHSGIGIMDKDIQTISPDSKELLTNNGEIFSWIEMELPDFLINKEFDFNLKLTALNLSTNEKIEIDKNFNMEYGTKFGYRGFFYYHKTKSFLSKESS